MSCFRIRPGAGARSAVSVAAASALLSAPLACGPGGKSPLEAPERSRSGETAPQTAAQPDPNAERYVWQAFTRSPLAAGEQPAELAEGCATPDAALVRVAERIARRELEGAPLLEVAEVAFALRAEGAPYVRPRYFTLRGATAQRDAKERIDAWQASDRDAGELRCGVAVASANGISTVAAVSASVIADLEELPTQVRVGEWLDVRARLLEPARAAAVLVLGPRGSPHRVTASLNADRVRARFRADREGTWLVQMLADLAGGPRPVAEALVFAGTAPSTFYAAEPAPGETDASMPDPAEHVTRMLNAARESEGLGALARDVRLDRAALAHAEAMRAFGHAVHDAGDGSPDERARAAGVSAALIGENVAHARTATLAHRALWASPSHRANLLEPAFDAVGIGVVPGEDGSVWVSELFAKLRRGTP